MLGTLDLPNVLKPRDGLERQTSMNVGGVPHDHTPCRQKQSRTKPGSQKVCLQYGIVLEAYEKMRSASRPFGKVKYEMSP